MEKISGILPTSHRFRKIDVSDSPAARPGAPGLGKQIGALPVQERIRFSPEAVKKAFAETLGGHNPSNSIAHQRIQSLGQELSQSQYLDEVFNQEVETPASPPADKVDESDSNKLVLK